MVCVVAWTEASLKASHSCGLCTDYFKTTFTLLILSSILRIPFTPDPSSFFGGRRVPLYLPYPTNIHGAVALTSRGLTNPPGKSFSSINQQSSASAPYPTPPPKEGMFRWL